MTGNALAAALLLLAAPVACLQAAINAGAAGPGWARGWNGFRLADQAVARLSGDPERPEAGLALGPGAAGLARAAYAREPLASDALFVLALAESPLREDYRAGPVAIAGARLDQRNALLQLLLIADAARREDYPTLFAHADILAAAHPALARTVLAPLFERLGDPTTARIVGAALARQPRWAAAFKSDVPREQAALRNYLALRRAAPPGERWPSDERLVGALADTRLYDDAFAAWRAFTGRAAGPYGFVADAGYAPIGWRLTEEGDRYARIGADGAMQVAVERGGGGELARQLLRLPPGRYRLEARIASDGDAPPLRVALQCVSAGGVAAGQPLAPQTELSATEGACPAYWLVLSASALESRHRVEATLSGWRFSRIG